jgi:MSHA pilin protein MshC
VIASRGFSLLELVVVMVIAGVLAAIAIPRLTDSESQATWYHEQALAAVRFAQRQAVAQRRNVYVCINSSSVLNIDYDSTCAVAHAQACSSSATVIQVPQKFCGPSGVNNSSTTTPFSFDGLGQPSPIGGVTVTVSGRSINVTAQTGYVF